MKISKNVLKDSIIIVDSVVNETHTSKKLLKSLNKISKIAPIVMVCSTDNNRDQTKSGFALANFKKLFQDFKFYGGFYGYIPRNLYQEKKEILYIGGKWACFVRNKTKIKVCAIISTYNEEDIIGQICKYLLEEGIDIHIIDNWSTDRTLEKIKDLSKKHKEITWEIFPTKDLGQHLWFDMLNKKVEYSISRNYDWYIHYDADEIREDPWVQSLLEGIKFVDSLEFNAIDHTIVDFRPVKEGFNERKDPQKFFGFYEFGRRPGHFAQIKAWKNIVGTEYNLSSNGGHVIEFEGKKVFPYKFLLRHYPLRSLEHMKKKIYKDRLPRFEQGKKERGWHNHYDKFIGLEKSLKLWKIKELGDWTNSFYEEYLLERLFGLNIKKD